MLDGVGWALAGNIAVAIWACTYCFSISADYSRISTLSLATGVLIVEFLLDQGLEALSLSWPNDIVSMEGEKLGGILLQSLKSPSSESCEIMHILIGVGLNIYPSKIDNSTSLEQLCPTLSFEAKDLARQLIASISKLWDNYSDNDAFFKYYLKRCNALSFERAKVVLACSESRDYTGIFEGVASDGAALIRSNDGNIVELQTGTVSVIE